MNFTFKYSGLFVIFFSWGAVVLPYYFLKNKKKAVVLSDVGALSEAGQILNIGVMLVSISQFVFWVYISSVFPLGSIVRAALILFYASFHLLLAGIIHRGIDKGAHDLLTHIYFIFSLLGAYLLSSAFSVTNLEASYLLRIVILASILGTIFLYKQRKSIFVELWHIILCSTWIILIYLYIL